MEMAELWELHIVCSITKLSCKIAGPYRKKTLIEEEKRMYERHIDPSMATFSIVRRDIEKNPLTSLEDMFADKENHNPFNSEFKLPKSTTYIPKIPDDPRDVPWLIVTDNSKKEVEWCIDKVSEAAGSIYETNSDITKSSCDMYGSLWHCGLVQHIFGPRFFPFCRGKNNNLIEQIGNKYDPKIISKIHSGYPEEGIYVSGFGTEDVKKLCEYISLMFGVNKFEVAKLFELRDPADIHLPDNDVSCLAYNQTLIAAIFAEKGDIESAREYYKKSVDTLEGKNWQSNFKRKLEQFEKYVSNNGTSVLSSNF